MNLEKRDMTEKLTHVYMMLMLGLFPLWVGWSGYSNLTAQKYGFFTAATVLWLALLLVCALRERDLRFQLTAGQRAVCALTAGLCLSALCSPYGADTLVGAGRYDGLVTWGLYAAIFWGVSRYGRFRLSQAYALAAESLVNCAVAVVQLMGYNCLWLFPGELTYYDAGTAYTGEFLSLIGNVDVLAACFCLTIPLFLGLYVTLGGRQTAPLAAAAGLNFFILLESGVAGGLAGLLLAVLVGAPMVLTDRERLSRGLTALAVLALSAAASQAAVFSENGVRIELCKLFWLLLCAGGLLAVCGHFLCRAAVRLENPGIKLAVLELLCVIAALAALYAVPPASGTLGELSMLLHGQVSDTFGSNRVTIWKEVWGLIRERPILGGGPDTLRLRTELTFSRYAETGTKLTVHLDNAHNEYLNLWVNGGLVSLVPYLALIAATLRRWRQHRGHPMLAPLMLALAAWWGQALFGLGLCILMPLLWILWGLAWSMPKDCL